MIFHCFIIKVLSFSVWLNLLLVERAWWRLFRLSQIMFVLPKSRFSGLKIKINVFTFGYRMLIVCSDAVAMSVKY